MRVRYRDTTKEVNENNIGQLKRKKKKKKETVKRFSPILFIIFVILC